MKESGTMRVTLDLDVEMVRALEKYVEEGVSSKSEAASSLIRIGHTLAQHVVKNPSLLRRKSTVQES